MFGLVVLCRVIFILMWNAVFKPVYRFYGNVLFNLRTVYNVQKGFSYSQGKGLGIV